MPPSPPLSEPQKSPVQASDGQAIHAWLWLQPAWMGSEDSRFR